MQRDGLRRRRPRGRALRPTSDPPPPTPAQEPVGRPSPRPGLGGGRGPVGVEGVLDLGAEIGFERGAVGLERVGRPVAGLRRALRCRRFGRALEAFGLAALVVLGALEQRIAGEFVLDEGAKLDVRHLQQLDRLKQLRRQNHRLTLPHRQFGRKRHCTLAVATLKPARRRSAIAARFLLARLIACDRAAPT